MNTTKGGVPSRWETVIGTLSSYSEYFRLCVDILLDSPPPYSTYLRFPQDVTLTMRFNLSSGSSVSLIVGQDVVFPDLQIAALTSICFPLSMFAAPIQSVSAEVKVPAAALYDSTSVYMDRVRLERMTVAQEPPSSNPQAPSASAPVVLASPASQQPQVAASRAQLQPKAAQQPQQQSAAPSRTSSQTNTATSDITASMAVSCLFALLGWAMSF
jgi:hypothetical protein